MTYLAAYAAGVVPLIVGLALGWIARDRIGVTEGEPSVKLTKPNGGWEEPYIGEEE